MPVSDTQEKQIKALEKAVTRLQVRLEDTDDVVVALARRIAKLTEVQELQAKALRRLSQ